MLSAEHRRPLAAFILVALVCALVVGQSVRNATLKRLVDGGLPLGVLVPIAPDMLFTIGLSGDSGLGGDVPYVGRAVIAVSHPAPPSSPVTIAVGAVPISSPSAVVRTVARSAAGGATAGGAPAGGATAGEATRAAGRQPAPPRRAPTVAPARETPTLSPGRTKHGAGEDAKPVRTDNEGRSHKLNRGQHTAANASDRQEGHDNRLHRGHQKGHDNGLHRGHQKGHDNGLHKGQQKHPKQHQPQHPKQDQKDHQKDHQKPH